MILEPLILYPRSKAQKIIDLRGCGYSYDQIGKILGKGRATVARYHRAFLNYGPEAFTNG